MFHDFFLPVQFHTLEQGGHDSGGPAAAATRGHSRARTAGRGDSRVFPLDRRLLRALPLLTWGEIGQHPLAPPEGGKVEGLE